MKDVSPSLGGKQQTTCFQQQNPRFQAGTRNSEHRRLPQETVASRHWTGLSAEPGGDDIKSDSFMT